MTDAAAPPFDHRLLRREARLIGALLPGLLLLMVNATLLNLPMREVTNGLDSDRYRVLWIICAYGVAYTFGCMMTGLFAGQVGLSRTFWGSLVVFGLFGMLSGLAGDVTLMTPLRIVQGFAKGVGLTAAMVILWKRFPGQVPVWMALYGVIAFSGALLGVPLGGAVTHWLSWRWLFFLQLPLGVLAALVAALLLPDDRPAARQSLRVDFLGVVLTLGWLSCLLVAVGLGQFWGWLDSSQVILWLVGFVLFFLAFLGWGALLSAPAIPTRILAVPRYVVALLTLDLYAINLYGLLGMLSGYMIDHRGYQWHQGSAALLSALPTMLAGVALYAVAVHRLGRRVCLFAGLCVMALGTLWLAAVDLYTPGYMLAVALAFWGLGVGVATVPAMAGLFDGLTSDQVFQQTGIFNLNRFAPALVASLLMAVLVARSADEHADRLRLAFSHNRPGAGLALRHAEEEVHTRSGLTNGAPAQARAALGQWVRLNARAFGVQTVLRYLALLTALGLPLALLAGRGRDAAQEEWPGLASAGAQGGAASDSTSSTDVPAA
jgi:DHA2 family multidrug resistance protein